MAYDPFTDATQQGAVERAMTVRADNDQIRLKFLRSLENRLYGRALHEQGLRVDTALPQRLRQILNLTMLFTQVGCSLMPDHVRSRIPSDESRIRCGDVQQAHFARKHLGNAASVLDNAGGDRREVNWNEDATHDHDHEYHLDGMGERAVESQAGAASWSGVRVLKISTLHFALRADAGTFRWCGRVVIE